jgi:hypothetical protein
LIQARSAGGDNSVTAGSLGYAYAVSGNRGAALAILRELDQREPKSWYDTARVYIALGNHDAAFRMLEKCFENRCREMIFLRVAPVLDPLRSDPRFAALVARERLGS